MYPMQKKKDRWCYFWKVLLSKINSDRISSKFKKIINLEKYTLKEVYNFGLEALFFNVYISAEWNSWIIVVYDDSMDSNKNIIIKKKNQILESMWRVIKKRKYNFI